MDTHTYIHTYIHTHSRTHTASHNTSDPNAASLVGLTGTRLSFLRETSWWETVGWEGEGMMTGSPPSEPHLLVSEQS